MLESFHVKNLRCLENVKINGLKRVNLITGENNVGKTAFLESLFLHSAGTEPRMVFTIDSLRGFDTLKLYRSQRTRAPWSPLFANFSDEKEIILTGTDIHNKRRVVELRMITDPDEIEKTLKRFRSSPDIDGAEPIGITQIGNPHILEMKESRLKNQVKNHYMLHDGGKFQVSPIPIKPTIAAYYMTPKNPAPSIEQADRFAELQLDRKDSLLLDVLKLVEPRLTRVSMVVHAGHPVIHGDIGLSRLVPIPFMGAGMMRLTAIVLGIITFQNGVLLIDEIEVGLHHSIMEEIWTILAEISEQFQTQIFATTHSRECVISAHEAFRKGSDYNFNYSRLEWRKGKVHSISYDIETLQAALDSSLEVR